MSTIVIDLKLDSCLISRTSIFGTNGKSNVNTVYNEFTINLLYELQVQKNAGQNILVVIRTFMHIKNAVKILQSILYQVRIKYDLAISVHDYLICGMNDDYKTIVNIYNKRYPLNHIDYINKEKIIIVETQEGINSYGMKGRRITIPIFKAKNDQKI